MELRGVSKKSIFSLQVQFVIPMISNDFKIGLVIQGPLVSKGRTGSTVHIPFDQVKEGDVVEYNCVDNIINVYDAYTSVFVEIICVVWDDEDPALVKELIDSIGSENVYPVKDITKKITPRGQIIGGNNKYRQIYSTLKGVQLLKERGCDHVIKMRSDQMFDLRILLNNYLNVLKKRTGFVMLPRIPFGQWDCITDFYFVASINLFENLLESYLGADEFFDSVHTDLFYQWATQLYGSYYLPLSLRSTVLYDKYICNLWNSVFIPASEDVYMSLVWRGDKILESSADNSFFLEDFDSNYLVSCDDVHKMRNSVSLFNKLFYSVLIRLKNKFLR